MRRWNLPQVNTKVMCAVLTAAMVMTGFTACGGSTTASAASTEASENKETIAPESTTESTESGEEKVESYLGQITAIDGNVISIAFWKVGASGLLTIASISSFCSFIPSNKAGS